VLETKEFIDKVDDSFAPGEFGLENYWCRVMACLIFMMAEVRELFATYEMIVVLCYTPHRAENWVIQTRSNGKGDPLQTLKFRVAGMSIGWKIFNFIILVIPKAFLLYNVCSFGVRFLMDTAGIVELVLGAMTMDFILTLDELLFDGFSSVPTKFIMNNLEGFTLDPPDADEDDSVEQYQGSDTTSSESHMVAALVDATSHKTKWGAIKLTLPIRLIITLLVLFVFLLRYYLTNCELLDRMWVSKPMFLPTSTKFSWMSFLTGHVPMASAAFWNMSTFNITDL